MQDYRRIRKVFHFDCNEVQQPAYFIQQRISDTVDSPGLAFREFIYECDGVIIAFCVFRSSGQAPEDLDGFDTIDVL